MGAQAGRWRVTYNGRLCEAPQLLTVDLLHPRKHVLFHGGGPRSAVAQRRRRRIVMHLVTGAAGWLGLSRQRQRRRVSPNLGACIRAAMAGRHLLPP